jgi:hypothetical protein
MNETARNKSFFSRVGRWLAELILVFVGVYAAFWLNNLSAASAGGETARPDPGIARANAAPGN